MAIREISMEVKPDGEQLTFLAFELADAVRELLQVELNKKFANQDFNDDIKALKKRIMKLSAEIPGDRK